MTSKITTFYTFGQIIESSILSRSKSFFAIFPISPFGLYNGSCFGFTDGISFQISEDITGSMLGIGFGQSQFFEQLVDSR